MNGSVVIAAGARTPIGRFGGSLSRVPLAEFTAVAMREAMARAGVRPEEVEQVVMGQVYQGGFRANPARQAALLAALPVEVPAALVNQQCSSGSRALEIAADLIRLGRAEIVLAGGMDAMSQVPYILPHGRWGSRLGDETARDGLLWDALVDPTFDEHMGVTADLLAKEYDIAREEADRFALLSQQRAAVAGASGRLAEEITAVPLAAGSRGEGRFTEDEHPRHDTSYQALAALGPVFSQDGITTAGNASGLNDGATAIVLMAAETAMRRGIEPLAVLVDSVSVAVEPRRMGIGPVPAVRALLARTGLGLAEIDLVELNEAFAAQVLACQRELKIPEDRLNVNGGAIALGHPPGSTGARLVLTLAYELRRSGGRYGIATQCAGGGPAMATLIERPN